MESQSPVFWWNEMKEPIVPIIFPPSATNARILAALYLQLPRYEFHHPKMSAKYLVRTELASYSIIVVWE